MNITKPFMQLRLWLASRLNAKKDSGESQRKRCERMLKTINLNQFALYQATDGFGENILVPFHTIDAYTEKLRELTRVVKKEAPVPVTNFEALERVVSVDKFFISAKGFYQDVPMAVARFRAAGLELCLAMAPADGAEYGPMEYNGRILERLFINVQAVASALARISIGQ